MKPKIVRYTTKSGVVKTYVYDKDYSKSRRSNILVSSKGVIYKQAVNKLEQKIRNSDMSPAEQAEFISSLKYEVSKRSKEIKEGIPNKKRLTVNGFYGIMEDTRLDTFFANFGSSLEQFAEEYGFDVEEVRAKGKFKGKDLVVNGRTFKFNYDYQGDFYTEVL